MARSLWPIAPCAPASLTSRVRRRSPTATEMARNTSQRAEAVADVEGNEADGDEVDSSEAMRNREIAGPTGDQRAVSDPGDEAQDAPLWSEREQCTARKRDNEN